MTSEEVTGIHGYWQVMNSKLLERKTEKQDPGVKCNCATGMKANENWMSAETSLVRDVAGRKGIAGDQCAKLWKSTGQGGKFKV